MKDGADGKEEGATAQPVKDEAAQDEDILTFEEFKQRRMMEAQLQQEELKNSGRFELVSIDDLLYMYKGWIATLFEF